MGKCILATSWRLWKLLVQVRQQIRTPFQESSASCNKSCKKDSLLDTAKQMGTILAEKGAEAATDLIANAIGGDVSAATNIGNLQKKLVKNLSSVLEKIFGFWFEALQV